MSEWSCERCGATIPTAETIKLIGGRLAHLCIACRNAWREWIRLRPAWGERLAVSVKDVFLERSTVSGHLVDEADWADLQVRKEAVDQRIYDLSGDWLEEGKVKREESQAAKPVADASRGDPRDEGVRYGS